MKKSKEEPIIIYCDGACSGNQNANATGGWGVVMSYDGHIKELSGGERNTTNQRMEITACLKALQEIKKKDIPVEIYSDSAYVVNCFKERWYESWERNGWKNAKKKPVENQDLWKPLIVLVREFGATFHKVTGHTGVELNERADELARMGVTKAKGM